MVAVAEAETAEQARWHNGQVAGWAAGAAAGAAAEEMGRGALPPGPTFSEEEDLAEE